VTHSIIPNPRGGHVNPSSRKTKLCTNKAYIFLLAMVVPAFGFSVGDFVAIIELVSKTVKALKENGGVIAKRYELTLADLRTIETILRHTHNLQASDENDDVVQQIKQYGNACHEPLARFVQKLRKYEVLAKPQSTETASLKLLRAGRSIQWTVVVAEEVARLKAAIGPQLVVISLLLQLAAEKSHAQMLLLVRRLANDVEDIKNAMNVNRADRDEVRVDTEAPSLALDEDEMDKKLPDRNGSMQSIKNHSNATLSTSDAPSTFLQIRKAILDFFSALLLVLPTFQAFLAASTKLITAPSTLLDDNIHIVDALGRQLSLPYAHFRFWPVLRMRLDCDFKGLPGELRVKAGQFAFIDVKDPRQYVEEMNWGKVRPGARLAMSVFYDFQTTKMWCPNCSTAAPDGDGKTWVRW
jgi:hypothetical protein